MIFFSQQRQEAIKSKKASQIHSKEYQLAFPKKTTIFQSQIIHNLEPRKPHKPKFKAEISETKPSEPKITKTQHNQTPKNLIMNNS